MALTGLSHRLMRGAFFTSGLTVALPDDLGFARRAAIAALTVVTLGMRKASAAAWQDDRSKGGLRNIALAFVRAVAQTLAVTLFRPINRWKGTRGDADVHNEIWARFLAGVGLAKSSSAARDRDLDTTGRNRPGLQETAKAANAA
ncbi:MAG: hypothetical protein JWO27_2927 [Frankiales bacterium]|nr:hypothetical protein [Frankiales bacterium]